MWKLELPDNSNALEQLRVAFTYANGHFKYRYSEGELEEVGEIYSAYEEALGRPLEELKGLTSSRELRDAIYEAYNEVQKSGRLSNLREALMSAASRCPLCGIGAVTDLDHHLARSKYKPLSIYPGNLVPVCGTCNNAKRAVGEEDGDEFVHAYYTELPDEQFLSASVDLVDEALRVQFSIIRPPEMPVEVFDIVLFQFERLGLNRRYQDEVNLFLCGFVTSMKDTYGVEKNAYRVVDWATRTAEALEKSFGKNDWRPVLFNAIAECYEFCDGGFLKALGAYD